MNDIKIIFTDLDSTLTEKEGKIDFKYKTIFERFADIGIPVVINTGRSIPYTIPLCKQFSTSNYLVASNGAEIYNYLNKKVIYRNIITRDNLKVLDELIKKFDLFYVANGVTKRYSNKVDNTGIIFSNYLMDINEEFSQVVLQSYDIEVMKQVRREIEKTNNLKIINKTHHIEEGKLLYYDIVNNDVSKGNALKILCDYLKIDCKKAIAIGDSTNDIEMLKAAGYKVAVYNASDDVKEIADIITLSNKENGLAILLNEIYNQKGNK
jgi:Cof subfamily protein (haloacid dehalogenase superfamily)